MKKTIKSLFAIVISLNAANSFACSCAQESTQQKYSNASGVFLGKVIETELETKTQIFGDQEISDDHVRAIISVTKTMKGKHSQSREILDSVANGANCGLGLLTGREYLFFLYGDESISICGGSKLYDEFSDKELIEEMLSY